jgi:hypothetical protein
MTLIAVGMPANGDDSAAAMTEPDHTGMALAKTTTHATPTMTTTTTTRATITATSIWEVTTEAASGQAATAAAADGEGAILVEGVAEARESADAEDGEATMIRGQDTDLEQQ